MERIDCHQHFWNYDPACHTWMTAEMGILKRNYGPGELSVLLERYHLQGSVAVQASQSEDENEFLLQMAEQNSFIKGIVGWVDLQSVSVSDRLLYYSSKKKMKGFRHVIHDEEDIDFMLRPAFLNGIKSLAAFGFTYDLLVYPDHLQNSLELVRRFPDQSFVIDHIAKPGIARNEVSDWKRLMAALASSQNVRCKISGMVTEAPWKKWQKEDFTPYLDTVVELFGTKRIMYGSDWPVCTLSASYEQTYGLVKDYFDDYSPDEQNDFFGLNAKRFYNL